jgi:hypothetical protein
VGVKTIAKYAKKVSGKAKAALATPQQDAGEALSGEGNRSYSSGSHRARSQAKRITI